MARAAVIASALAMTVGNALGAAVVTARRPPCGLTAALRWVVGLDDGRTVFVKAATDDATAAWLATETDVLASVQAPWAPRVIAQLTHAGRPVLVTEGLRHLYWPADHGTSVVWRAGDVERVLATLADVGATPAPPALTPNVVAPCWRAVLAEPAAVVRLGLCSPAWLERIAPALADLDDAANLDGDRLVHGDVRSDNVGLDEARVVFVDWSQARRGHPRHDLAELLPYLHLEGAPPPITFADDPSIAPFVARTSGRLARRTLTGDVPAPWLHRVLRRTLAIQLDWLTALLGWPPRDGSLDR